VTIDMGSLGPDAVTVGAATLPLAAFFTRGGRRTPPEPPSEAPSWQTSLEVRGAAGAGRS
ncbi:sugar kinase, partial [Streptomyces sp. NPDC054956]